MEHALLTAQEVADLLQIKKNTVYELIRRGELPSSKVGKQVRISRQDIEALLRSTKTGIDLTIEVEHNKQTKEPFILSGQDRCLEMIVNRASVPNEEPIFRLLTGCYDGLYALYHNRVSMAAVHLWDAKADEYNKSFIEMFLPGIPVKLLRLVGRQQGFYVAKGNPKKIMHWLDLSRDDVTMMNREKGCGTRILIDQKLKEYGIGTQAVMGYNNYRNSHVAVATVVAKQEADVGIGCENAMVGIESIEFVPLQKEWYDLVFYASDEKSRIMSRILNYICSSEFVRDMEIWAGYDLSQAGKIII